MPTSRMTSAERHAALSLASIFSLRMFGLFLVLPVLALYAARIPGADAMTLGLAMGIYGLTQGCLQIPFGVLSDKYGRKPIIALGLVLFAIGSLVAGTSHTVVGLIVGRGLQGAAAIGSTVMAYVADTTRDEVRTRAMAMVGSSIGFAFALAMVLGPVIDAHLGLHGIFLITAALAVCALFVLKFWVPPVVAPVSHVSWGELKQQVKAAITNLKILKLNLGIFVLHAILTALFLVLPLQLQHEYHIDKAHQSFFYLIVMLVSFVLFVPAIIQAERKQLMHRWAMVAMMMVAISLLGLSQVHQHLSGSFLMLTLFFAAFNFLEAILPSWVSRLAPTLARGTTMAVFSSMQFLGIFIGGVLGGAINQWQGAIGVYGFCLALAVTWLLLQRLTQPSELRSPIWHQEGSTK